MSESVDAIAQPKIEQKSPIVQKEQPKGRVAESISRLASIIKNKLGGPKPNPDDALEDVANFDPGAPVQVPEAKEAKPLENEAGLQPQTGENSQPENSLEVDAMSELPGEEVASAELSTTQDTGGTATPAETQLTYEELRELHSKQNEVKWKVDEVAAHIDQLSKGETPYKDFVEKEIERGMNWIVEDSVRASEAAGYILTQEDIIDLASTLPGLNAEERKNIDSMRDIIQKIRSRLEGSGVVMPHGQPPNIDVEEENVENASVPTNPETAFEYAYHATQLTNMPSVAEQGLLPSGSWSKEPGTIFFNGYNWATQYLPALGMLYRVPISHIPEFSDQIGDNGRPRFEGVSATRHPIQPNLLEYSIDRGQTWRHDFSKFINN